MNHLMKLIDNRTIPLQNRPGGIGGKPSNSPSFLKSQYDFITKYGQIKVMSNGLQFQYKRKNGTWSRPFYPFCNSKQFGFNISKKNKTHINSSHKISGASRRIPEAFSTIKKISKLLQESIKKNNSQLYKELQSISKKCKKQHLHFGLWTSCSVQLNMPSCYHYDKTNLDGIATIIAWSNNNQSGILSIPELKVGLNMIFIKKIFINIMIEIFHFVLYYFYQLLNKKYDYYFLKNIYCKKNNVIYYLLKRNPIIQEKYNNDQNSNLHTKYKENIRKNISIHGYYITINNYPYSIKKNIIHNIIWCNKNKEEIKNILNCLYEDYVFFKNIQNNKSIKDIEHYHIFINTK